MARVLVTGASGLLGRAIMKAFQSEKAVSSFTILGLCHSRSGPGLRSCDLRDEDQVLSVFSDFKPNIVIHAAAEKRPDVVENQPAEAKALNVTATSRLCRLADECGALVIYISTDYVFDGTAPPYKITDTPNPLNAYGLSKWEGEVAALKYKRNSVLRVPILYGEIDSLSESGVTTLFTKVKDSSAPAKMESISQRYPTHCGDVAKVLINYLNLPDDRRPSGILHWSTSEMLTKYDMALTIAEVMGLSSEHIVADQTPPSGAPRPKDSHLDSSVLSDLGCGSDRPFREGIAASLAPFAN